jgi:hypothetical protein
MVRDQLRDRRHGRTCHVREGCVRLSAPSPFSCPFCAIPPLVIVSQPYFLHLMPESASFRNFSNHTDIYGGLSHRAWVSRAYTTRRLTPGFILTVKSVNIRRVALCSRICHSDITDPARYIDRRSDEFSKLSKHSSQQYPDRLFIGVSQNKPLVTSLARYAENVRK